MLLVAMIWPSIANEQNDFEISEQTIFNFPSVTWDLRNGLTGSYRNFLTRIRNSIEAPTRPCGVQSTRSNSLPGTQYLYIKLQISNTEWVLLGMDARNLYIWAYEDNFRFGPDGKIRSTFLSDAPNDARSNLFPGSIRRFTNFGGNYAQLEPRAGVSRLNINFAVQSLDNAIRSVRGKPAAELDSGNDEARFFLLAIQMVAEAARLKFMENGIVTPPSPNDNQAFRVKMVAFQNDWTRISTAIHNSEAATPKCGNFPAPLLVGGRQYPSVDSIKNDMGILRYRG